MPVAEKLTGWESSGRARAQARARFWDATLALLGRYAGMNECEDERLDVYKAASDGEEVGLGLGLGLGLDLSQPQPIKTTATGH